ncbi:cytochrome P450 [Coprinopsis cinerea okayama7|uniref:Cytochrome P450 n=1 Tax=Coprinopsis cinerea (strain Okayama-7 / 130 / ATCC MYA-4618 / FGSC 9003) TaxID=240176 RepID=A8PBV3_COPC7|nr:cytochrome P450 [Coprinopsis cinerea okayama7\|eukprot:XP_001840275.2 cytochrome P450 [Coprinopsis cinerea okayama7\
MAYLSVLGFVLAAWIAFQWALFRISERKVRHIPTVGSDGFISSYISAWKFMLNGRKIVQEGYEKHKGSVFKVPTIMTANRWLIVGAGADVADEFKRASEEELSFYDATFELFQRDFILGDLGPPVRKNRYHIDVIRGPLTRGLPLRFEDLKDEIETSVGVFIPLTEDWAPIQVYGKLLHIVSRTTNRIFVGLPPEHRVLQDSGRSDRQYLHRFSPLEFVASLHETPWWKTV